MTLVDAPPMGSADVRRAVARARRSGPRWSTWRFAARLARREVRRRPGRTALVAALVAIPVLAMTFAFTVANTKADTAQERFERSAGRADLVTYGGDVGAVEQLLPAGSRSVTVTEVSTNLTARDGRRIHVLFRVGSFADPLVDGIIEIESGRAPAAAGEVLLQADVARALGVAVGESFELERPSGTWTVVGIGRAAADFHQPLFAVSEFSDARIDPAYASVNVLADLPDSLDSEQLAALVRAGGENVSMWLAPRLMASAEREAGWSWYYDESKGATVSTEQLAWGWVAGALTLAAVGVIIAAAFASSARRQLTTVGQLTANGAPERLVRGTLACQGAWTGLVGSAVGVTAALCALPFSRSLLERFVARGLGDWEIDPVALVVILATGVAAATIAAMVPARSAARIPVLAALAGRRPLGAIPRRLVPIGLASFAGGVGLLVVATVASTNGNGSNANLYAASAVIGGLAVTGGMCCASPIAVDLVGRAGADLAGSWRLAARSIARSRTRSAGVLTAIAVTGAATVAIVTAVGSLAFGDEHDVPFVARDTVVLTALRYDYTPPLGASPDEPVNPVVEAIPLDENLVARVAQVIPDATTAPHRRARPARHR